MPTNSPSKEAVRTPQSGQVARRRGYEPFPFTPREFFANPSSMLRRMHEEMDRAFSDIFQPRGDGQNESSLWAPAIEVTERDNQMLVCAELPGLRPEDIKVELTDDALVIQGERKLENEQEENGRWRTERRYGRFYRAIPLPEGAASSQAKAAFQNGELQVTIPVEKTESRRRQIPVETR